MIRTVQTLSGYEIGQDDVNTLVLHGPGLDARIPECDELSDHALRAIASAIEGAYQRGQRDKVREIRSVLLLDPNGPAFPQ